MFRAELDGKTSVQRLIVASSPLSLVSGTWSNDQLVYLVLGASLETRFGLQTISYASSHDDRSLRAYRGAPWAHWMDVAFRLSSTTSMRMLVCVHGQSTHRWSPSKPTLPPRFSKRSILIVDIACHADRC